MTKRKKSIYHVVILASESSERSSEVVVFETKKEVDDWIRMNAAAGVRDGFVLSDGSDVQIIWGHAMKPQTIVSIV